MRAGVGLLALLIGVAIILMVSFSGPHGGYVPTVLSKGQQAQSDASQLAGKDENGIRAMDSIGLTADDSSGKLKGLVVSSVLAGGPMQTVYGIALNDEIVATGPMRVRDENDVELAKAMVWDGYQKNWPLRVIRNGQEIELTPNGPLSQHFGPPGSTGGSAPVEPGGTSIQQQLNQIQSVPTH